MGRFLWFVHGVFGVILQPVRLVGEVELDAFTGTAMTEKEPIFEKIRSLVDGAMFLSETDAAIEPFFLKMKRGDSREVFLRLVGDEYETQDAELLFARLTRSEDWYTPERKQQAARMSELAELLKDRLRGLAVYRFGRIRITIYLIGTDADGNLAGIRTEAVET